VHLDVIITSQVERFAHAANVSLRKKRANVLLKARRFHHCSSQRLDYTYAALAPRDSKRCLLTTPNPMTQCSSGQVAYSCDFQGGITEKPPKMVFIDI
jgi:hypothetical protein